VACPLLLRRCACDVPTFAEEVCERHAPMLSVMRLHWGAGDTPAVWGGKHVWAKIGQRPFPDHLPLHV